MAESTTPTRSFGARVRQFFVTLGIAALAAAGAAGFVMVRDMGIQGDLEQQVADADAQCDARLQQITAARDAALQNVSRLHAFLDIAGARDELSKGNFGNARARKVAAAKHLERGGDAELAKQVGAVTIKVTEDLQTTQQALATVEAAVEALIDHPDPAAATP